MKDKKLVLHALLVLLLGLQIVQQPAIYFVMGVCVVTMCVAIAIYSVIWVLQEALLLWFRIKDEAKRQDKKDRD